MGDRQSMSEWGMDLSVERIEEAARVIDPVFRDSPQFVHDQLSEALGRRVSLSRSRRSTRCAASRAPVRRRDPTVHRARYCWHAQRPMSPCAARATRAGGVGPAHPAASPGGSVVYSALRTWLLTCGPPAPSCCGSPTSTSTGPD